MTSPSSSLNISPFSFYPAETDHTCSTASPQQSPNRLKKFSVKNEKLQLFTRIEGDNLLHWSSHLFSKERSEENQKILLIWCKIFKESFGCFFSHLFLELSSVYEKNLSFEWMKAMQKLIEMREYKDPHTGTSLLKKILPLLQLLKQQRLTLKEFLEELDLLQNRFAQQQFAEKGVEAIFDDFSGIDSLDMKFPLSKEDLHFIFAQYALLNKKEEDLNKSNLSDWILLTKEIRKRYACQTATADDLITLLAIGRKAISFKYGIRPYHTQLLTILGLLKYPANLKGRIAQVRTGEGKSTIIALLAFICACQGKVVDIVSSSHYLAKRDAEKYASFFAEFQIETSSLGEKAPTDDYFRCQILYGTNRDFEFAWMRDQLGWEQKRKWMQNEQMIPRPFQVVIVDEVDNLFIDSALHSARIGTASLISKKWIYHPLLDFVRAHQKEVEVARLLWIYSKTIPLDLIQELRSDLSRTANREHIEALTNEQFANWLEVAYKALYLLKENRDYIIKRQTHEDTTTPQLCSQIVIVDWNNTGRLNEHSRWQSGLHQFLEAKHDIFIQEESLTISSLCHPIYFTTYKNIFGLTGTLGSELERREIETIYSIDSFDVPSHCKSLRQTLDPLICSSKESHYHSIVEEIQEIQSQDRSILVLFETIEETFDFSHYLRDKQIIYQLLNAQQMEEEDFIISLAGRPKGVTIATNTAGRGTDIILHPLVREKGGLHLLFTFFPPNERVELQGFGRAARQGQPGSCRLILQSDKPLNRLFEERKKSIKRLSTYRMARVAKEEFHHRFLTLFWQQLREFYNQPSDLFNGQVINKWIKEIQSQSSSIDQSHLKGIEELLQGCKDPHQAATSSLGKTIQIALGDLAKHHWAHFYNTLDEVADQTSITSLYETARYKWDSIFQILRN